jgi:hypothetical protein
LKLSKNTSPVISRASRSSSDIDPLPDILSPLSPRADCACPGAGRVRNAVYLALCEF